MAKVRSKTCGENCDEKVKPKRGRHCQWSEAMMASAVAAVHRGMSQRAACKTSSIPRSTLQMRLSGKTQEGTKQGRPTMSLSLQSLSTYIKKTLNLKNL